MMHMQWPAYVITLAQGRIQQLVCACLQHYVARHQSVSVSGKCLGISEGFFGCQFKPVTNACVSTWCCSSQLSVMLHLAVGNVTLLSACITLVAEAAKLSITR